MLLSVALVALKCLEWQPQGAWGSGTWLEGAALSGDAGWGRPRAPELSLQEQSLLRRHGLAAAAPAWISGG